MLISLRRAAATGAPARAAALACTRLGPARSEVHAHAACLCASAAVRSSIRARRPHEPTLLELRAGFGASRPKEPAGQHLPEQAPKPEPRAWGDTERASAAAMSDRLRGLGVPIWRADRPEKGDARSTSDRVLRARPDLTENFAGRSGDSKLLSVMQVTKLLVKANDLLEQPDLRRSGERATELLQQLFEAIEHAEAESLHKTNRLNRDLVQRSIEAIQRLHEVAAVAEDTIVMPEILVPSKFVHGIPISSAHQHRIEYLIRLTMNAGDQMPMWHDVARLRAYLSTAAMVSADWRHKLVGGQDSGEADVIPANAKDFIEMTDFEEYLRWMLKRDNGGLVPVLIEMMVECMLMLGDYARVVRFTIEAQRETHEKREKLNHLNLPENKADQLNMHVKPETVALVMREAWNAATTEVLPRGPGGANVPVYKETSPLQKRLISDFVLLWSELCHAHPGPEVAVVLDVLAPLSSQAISRHNTTKWYRQLRRRALEASKPSTAVRDELDGDDGAAGETKRQLLQPRATAGPMRRVNESPVQRQVLTGLSPVALDCIAQCAAHARNVDLARIAIRELMKTGAQPSADLLLAYLAAIHATNLAPSSNIQTEYIARLFDSYAAQVPVDQVEKGLAFFVGIFAKMPKIGPIHGRRVDLAVERECSRGMQLTMRVTLNLIRLHGRLGDMTRLEELYERGKRMYLEHVINVQGGALGERAAGTERASGGKADGFGENDDKEFAGTGNPLSLVAVHGRLHLGRAKLAREALVEGYERFGLLRTTATVNAELEIAEALLEFDEMEQLAQWMQTAEARKSGIAINSRTIHVLCRGMQRAGRPERCLAYVKLGKLLGLNRSPETAAAEIDSHGMLGHKADSVWPVLAWAERWFPVLPKTVSNAAMRHYGRDEQIAAKLAELSRVRKPGVAYTSARGDEPRWSEDDTPGRRRVDRSVGFAPRLGKY